MPVQRRSFVGLRRALVASVACWVPSATAVAVLRSAGARGATIAASSATPSSTDTTTDPLPAVIARFQQMDAELAQMGQQVESLHSGVLEVEGGANATRQGVIRAEERIAAIARAAANNTAEAAALKAEMVQAEAQVHAAAATEAILQKGLAGLEATALTLSSASSSIGLRVAELEAKAKDLLPSYSDLSQRLDKANATAEAYRRWLAGGNADANITAVINASFHRATERVERLAQDVRKQRSEEADDDDSP